MQIDKQYDLLGNYDSSSDLTSHELIDILNSRTVDLLTALHQKKNRDLVYSLKIEVEKIQDLIRQKKFQESLNSG